MLPTAMRLFTSATATGGLFALPLGLAMAWRVPVPEDDIVARAAEPHEVVLSAPAGAESAPVGPFEVGVDAPDGRAATVAGVSRRRVGTAARAVHPAAPEPAAKGKKKKRKCLPPNPAIRTRPDGVVVVERDLVSAYASRPASLSALGWTSRHQGADGRPDGFRVGGIRCGNDLHQVGLRNGDVVHSVNGKPLTSVPEALWAYATLKKEGRIRLRITRDGQPATLVVRIT